jgi:hypothetical protein
MTIRFRTISIAVISREDYTQSALRRNNRNLRVVTLARPLKTESELIRFFCLRL